MKASREQRKMTQKTLAKRVGVHRVTIARLETGVRRPSIDLLQRISRVLKVKVSHLLD